MGRGGDWAGGGDPGVKGNGKSTGGGGGGGGRTWSGILKVAGTENRIYFATLHNIFQ